MPEWSEHLRPRLALLQLSAAREAELSTQLYGVGSEDPLVFAGATVALLGSAAIAATIPALRAASINPTQALRGD